MWWAKVGRARIGVEGFETDLSQMRWRMRGARRGLRPNLPARRAFQRFESWEGEGEGEGGQRREGEGERAPRGSQAFHQACQASQASQAGLSRGIAWVPAWDAAGLPCCCVALTAAAQRVYRAANQDGYPVRAVSRLGSLRTVWPSPPLPQPGPVTRQG